MATKAAVLARFLLTIYRQTALRKVCSIFAANLSSSNVTQSLLDFCCQFIVKQCYAKLARFLLTICCQTALRKACSIFAANLSSSNVMQNLLDFCCQFAITLCTQALLAKHKLIADTDDTGFVTNL